MTIDTDYLISKEDQVTVDFSSELMENYFPECTVEGSENIRSILVGPEEPMVFCQDHEHKLQALLRLEGSTAGWVKLQLSEQAVSAFDTEYNVENDSFRIAKAEGNKVMFSQDFAMKDTDFEKFAELIEWNECQPENSTASVHNVKLGIDHMLYATTAAGRDAEYYMVDLNTNDQQHFTLPETGDKVLQFEMGNFSMTQGLFILYSVGNDTTLLYQALNRPITLRISTGKKINCFALLEGEGGEDTVYTGGDGVYEIKRDLRRFQNNITELPGDNQEVYQLRAAKQDDEVSIWTLCDDGLCYRTNRFFDQASDQFHIGSWTNPLVLEKGAEQFSCVKGKGIRNQLFTINTEKESTLNRLWQDAVTTLWNSHEVHIEEADSLREVACYASHVRFSANTGIRTFNSLKVKLSADSHLFVYVNATSYHIGPDEPAEIELDFTAEFTVICPVKDIACALLFIEADFLEHDIVMNPADGVMKKLETEVTSAEALKGLKRPNGETLLPADHGIEDDKLEEVTKAIQEMVKAANGMYADANAKTKASEVAARRMSTQQSPRARTTGGSGFSLGDLLQSALTAGQAAASFIVNTVGDAVHFVITIGDQVINWVANTVREIGRAIQSVWESIVVFFEDLFEFLAFLFGWQGILEAKDALKDFANNAMTSLQGEVGNIREFINNRLDDFIENFAPELTSLPSSLTEQTDVTQPPPTRSADPTCNWANSKTGYIGQADAPMPPALSGALEDFVKSTQHLINRLGEGFTSQLGVISEGFQDLIHGRKTFLEFLQMILNRLVGFSLMIIRELIEVMLRAIELMIGMAKEELNRAWQIPLISPLYRFITRSPQNPNGSQLSFLDFACLLVAIPSTIAYRIGEGREPFTQPNAREAYAQRGLTVFQLDLK